MVDETRVLRLLRSISDDVAVLKAEAAAGEDRRADPMWLRGVKYTFVTAIEACVDVAQHICAAEGWGPLRTTVTPSGCSESTGSSRPVWLSRFGGRSVSAMCWCTSIRQGPAECHPETGQAPR